MTDMVYMLLHVGALFGHLTFAQLTDIKDVQEGIQSYIMVMFLIQDKCTLKQGYMFYM
jgi:hypothetical protein